MRSLFFAVVLVASSAHAEHWRAFNLGPGVAACGPGGATRPLKPNEWWETPTQIMCSGNVLVESETEHAAHMKDGACPIDAAIHKGKP